MIKMIRTYTQACFFVCEAGGATPVCQRGVREEGECVCIKRERVRERENREERNAWVGENREEHAPGDAVHVVQGRRQGVASQHEAGREGGDLHAGTTRNVNNQPWTHVHHTNALLHRDTMQEAPLHHPQS